MNTDKAFSDAKPETEDQLHHWLKKNLNLDVPRQPLNTGNATPFDYLVQAFLNDKQPNDLVVWASRGSGKTFYAAIATVLDLLFKPGIQIKLLAGSLEQSRRMHEHIRRIFESGDFACHLETDITQRSIQLVNKSSAEILAQSHTSVRGTRPNKLRCDEVDLFDPDVWQAAQLVTRSFKECAGTIEALSTAHQPGGLMSTLLNENSRRILRWNVIDVLAQCPDSADCATCTLHPDCMGRAKHERTPAGHFHISDAIVMKQRASLASWEAEMLCQRAVRTGSVYPEFDTTAHTATFDLHPAHTLCCGMDFGFRSPTVILWATLDPTGFLRIIDERIESASVLDTHIEAILKGNPHHPAPPINPAYPIPEFIAVDPAGTQRSEQTGISAVQRLQRAGIQVRHRRSHLVDGLRAVRARLAPASGPPTLIIHSRCKELIRSLTNYRYPDDPSATTPSKDGHDHAADALRYLILNLAPRPACSIDHYI